MSPRIIAAVVIAWLASSAAARACPFCTALRPTLCEQREQAAVAALGELTREAAGKKTFRVHQAFTGKEHLPAAGELAIAVEWTGKPGTLALLFGEGDSAGGLEKLAWNAATVNETSLAYFAAAPTLRTPAAERLAYFVRFLEHPDALVADDVYQEFGHAPFSEVEKIADRLPQAKLRSWLVDQNIPQERKGFFGVALGLAKNDEDRKANVTLLEKIIAERATDFRAGFDGALAGYLLLAGEDALAAIGKRYFADPKAAEGDVRHAVSAVRFYYEQNEKIDRERFRAALRPLLDRPEFAMAAAVDLARWKDWQSLEKVAGLYAAAGYPQPATRDAVVAYLAACPEKRAAAALEKLRTSDPQGVASAEFKLGKLPPAKQ